MAGTGPAPKPGAERRRRNEPARGEWVDLSHIFKPAIATKPPARGRGHGPWHPRTLAAWKAWRADPVGQVWTPADLGAVVDLAYLHHEWVRGEVRLAAEIRLRMDGLGLTAKGKRDLRLRVQPPAEVADLAEKREERAKRPRLRAVDPAAAG